MDTKTNEIEMACIVCPMSCHIQISQNEEGEIISITGNTCKRGEAYARSEVTNPVRMVTGTVTLHNGPYRKLPVLLSGNIPKGEIFHVMEQIHQAEAYAPVNIKDVIISNVCGLGVDVIASRSVSKEVTRESNN